MSIIATFIAVIIVVVGIFFSQRNRSDFNQSTSTSKVISESEEQLKPPSPTNVEEDKSSEIPTITKAPTPALSQNKVSDYRYPNSQTISSSSDSLLLNSTDDTDLITNWYKEKIKNEGANVKTFVTTKTNDNVLNKLVGADGEKEIRVEISKEAGESLVKISVTINYF